MNTAAEKPDILSMTKSELRAYLTDGFVLPKF